MAADERQAAGDPLADVLLWDEWRDAVLRTGARNIGPLTQYLENRALFVATIRCDRGRGVLLRQSRTARAIVNGASAEEQPTVPCKVGRPSGSATIAATVVKVMLELKYLRSSLHDSVFSQDDEPVTPRTREAGRTASDVNRKVLSVVDDCINDCRDTLERLLRDNNRMSAAETSDPATSGSGEISSFPKTAQNDADRPLTCWVDAVRLRLRPYEPLSNFPVCLHAL